MVANLSQVIQGVQLIVFKRKGRRCKNIRQQQFTTLILTVDGSLGKTGAFKCLLPNYSKEQFIPSFLLSLFYKDALKDTKKRASKCCFWKVVFCVA